MAVRKVAASQHGRQASGKPVNTGGRPRLPDDVKRRRGTLQPCRTAPAPGLDAGARRALAPTLAGRDYLAIADGYIDDVVSGRVVACHWIGKTVRRFVTMRQRAADPGCAFTFSAAHAIDVCDFCERLPHVEGRWPTETVTLEPWQVFVLTACYGFRLPGAYRLVTVIFIQIARKSAKSWLVAALATYHMVKEREPGFQVILGASTGSQARIVFSIMQRMVRRSAWLRKAGLHVFANAITYDDLGGTAKPINSKSSSQDGLSPSFISLDESHAQTFELHDVLVSAMGARLQGMICCPTTAGYDLTSVGFALRSTAMKILDGVVVSDHTFVALYELDADDDWRDERVWIKAAPMIGITPRLDWVRRYCADAIATPGMQGEFETKLCCRWLHSARSWLSVQAWDRCADTTLTIDAFTGERAWIAVDLAERDDIAAAAAVFERDGLFYAFVRGYLPELVVNERARAVPEYRAWVKSGELITTPGNLTDYATIEADVRAWCRQFDVQAIVLERYGAMNMAANLCADGLPASIEGKSAKTFTTPAKELEARVKAHRFRHNGSSFLKWQASNVCCERRRDGSLLPTKEAATSPHKIDAIDAILLAMGARLAQPDHTPTYDIFFVGGRA
jgi:phage terminase large subunit-like protein